MSNKSRKKYEDDRRSEGSSDQPLVESGIQPQMPVHKELINSPMEKLMIRKRAFAQSFLRETITYGAFMVVFCLVTYTLRTNWTFYLTDTIRGTLLRSEWERGKSFATIASTADFFTWMDAVFLPTMFPTEWYNADPMTEYEKDFPMSYNFRIGRVRMRQVRGRVNQNCVIHESFQNLVSSCYGEYGASNEEDAAYGPVLDGRKLGVESAFTWQSSDDLCVDKYTPANCNVLVLGRRKAQYPPSGYVWDFSRTNSSAELKELQDNRWIDFQTRAVMVDFTVYNPNVRLLCSTQLLVEWFPTGAIMMTDSIKPMTLLALETGKDWTIFMGELLLCFSLLGYLVSEVREFRTYYKVPSSKCTVCVKAALLREGTGRQVPCMNCNRMFNAFRLPNCPQCGLEVPETHKCWRGYFRNFWTLLDLVNLVFFAVVFSVRFGLRVQMTKVNFDVGQEFLTFYPLAWTYAFSNWMNSVNALLCFAKTFKYLGKFRSLSTLVRTISKSKAELLYFIFIFLVVFLGFGLSFHLAFGTDLAGYKDWDSSLVTLFLSLLGEFNYPDLRLSNRLLAPLFFITYQIMVTFILANMFIAIISAGHEAAKEEISGGRDDYLSSALKLAFNNWKVNLAMRFGGVRNTALVNIRKLITHLEAANLTPAQLDDVRTFHIEVEHNPENSELFNRVLKDFNGKVDKQMTRDDYAILRNSVLTWRREKKREKDGLRVWEDDEEEAEDPASPGTAFSEVTVNRRVAEMERTMDSLFDSLSRISTLVGLDKDEKTEE